ncbi:hypothetical protein [Azospirillum halopraeferens]|uniref:hypothetical protein n=1 Tax=Azospirillum halopraeferens TaxID=34010 RepID=UPI00041C8D26|nr:hypothetical protein [Azospirillum halopraeferens]
MAESSPASRRLPPWLLRLTVAVALIMAAGTAVVAALEATGISPYPEPFVFHNANRIEAAADRAYRMPDSLLVVALGTERLRMATLDEAPLARLGRGEGLESLHLLRVTNDGAVFADFEPLLDRILAVRPDLVLIDLDLPFRERRLLAAMAEHARRLADRVEAEHPLPARNQVALQYARTCAPPPDGGPAATAAEQESRYTLAADATAYERVRAFAERAAVAGTRVVLLELRDAPALEALRFGDSSHPPEALARVAADPAFDLWRFPRDLHRADLYCNHRHPGEEARRAYSAWLVATIAATVGRPAAEAVSMR